MTDKQLTLPVIGMTCANCVAAVERNAKKAAGVSDAAVNFAAEKVTVTYDPDAPGGANAVAADVIARVNRAGYDVPTAVAELVVAITTVNSAGAGDHSIALTADVSK